MSLEKSKNNTFELLAQLLRRPPNTNMPVKSAMAFLEDSLSIGCQLIREGVELQPNLTQDLHRILTHPI